MKREKIGDLTPEWMVENGFKFQRCGICGQDEWAGMDFWIHAKSNFCLRGYLSTAYGGRLSPSGYFNAQWTTKSEISQGFELLTGRKLL